MKHIMKLLVTLVLWSALGATGQTNSAPLKPGDLIPAVTLRTEEDQPVELRKLVAQKPTVLVFYRGGWCPFCTRHLKELAGIEKELEQAGVQLLAISMDKPEKLRATPNHDQLGYQLLSDSEAVAIKAFGLAFKVDDATFEKYKGYGVDLEQTSGRNHRLLPHPAVFVVAPSGQIRFAHSDPDYKVRLSPEKILAVAREARR